MPWIRKTDEPNKVLFYHPKELIDVERRGQVLEYVDEPKPDPKPKKAPVKKSPEPAAVEITEVPDEKAL